MKEQTLLEQVIEAFSCLPGVGPKSAQRMLLHLLERDREGGRRLARILSEAIDKIGHCKSCRNLTEAELCEICSDGKRESNMICVVEAPSDVIAIEQSLSFSGQYFVLMGTLSPIDGRGPDEIGIDHLVRRCESGIQEIILAVSSTVEGEATAHYISEALKPLNVTISRLAQGIPLGGELEFVDGGTLSHAFDGRKSI
jgi:recombination protein RecR|tara:strand:- start:12 stop:605 length:594 start_codon:yes stop_codon:yes gene_type:complete